MSFGLFDFLKAEMQCVKHSISRENASKFPLHMCHMNVIPFSDQRIIIHIFDAISKSLLLFQLKASKNTVFLSQTMVIMFVTKN